MKLWTWWRAIQYFTLYGIGEMWKAKKLFLRAAWFAAKVTARKDAKRGASMNTEKLVERMSIAQVVMWAGLLHVEYEREPWSDDEYSNREDALRVALVNTIDEKLASQREEGVPSLSMADRHYLRTLMRDELIEMLNDPDTRCSVIEHLYEKFFESDKEDYTVKDGEYEERVSKCCNDYYEVYRAAIVKLLHEMS